MPERIDETVSDEQAETSVNPPDDVEVCRLTAVSIAVYYRTLCRNGVDKQAALALTEHMQRAYLATVFGVEPRL